MITTRRKKTMRETLRKILPLSIAAALTLGINPLASEAGGGGEEASAASAAPSGSTARVVRDDRVVEASGLARSTYKRKILWTHNDSGDGPRIFAIRRNGTTAAVVRLRGASAIDWEDMTAGAGHSLWVGDIGDNARSRDTISVYRVREPRKLRSRSVRAAHFRLAYPDGAHDAEALLVRPRTNRVFVVTKSSSGGAVYRAPKRLSRHGVNRLTRVASAPADVTAGSFARSGRFFVLGTYGDAYGYRRIGAGGVRINLPDRPQGESLTVGRSDRRLFVGSEGVDRAIQAVRIPRVLTRSRRGASTGGQQIEGWRVHLVENFDRLSSARWNVRDRTYNSNEDSYLLARNTNVSGGVLRITGRKEKVGGRNYTSGYVDTNGKYTLPDEFRVRVRAKVPMQQGLWAAPLWLRPADYSDGEIDLVETYGSERNRPRVHQTIHTGYGSGHQQSVRETPYAELGDRTGTGWHVYEMIKTRGRLVMKVDGVTTATWGPNDPSWYSRYYDAGKRWHLRINMQIGGDWGGLPDSSTDWSKATMAVDYVHTWVR